MVLTRAEGKDALTHFLKNVFKLEDDNPLFSALSEDKLLDIVDVINLPFDQIDKLTYIDDQRDERTLVRHYTILLHVFKSYFLHRRAQGNPIGDKWTDITYKNIADFRVGPDYPLAASIAHPPTALTPHRRVNVSEIPLPISRRGIKRDSSSFSVYKDEKQWDTWQHSTLAQARAQDVAEILDRKYVPNSSEERDLFYREAEVHVCCLRTNTPNGPRKGFRPTA
jgi:hypothetical protein